MENWNRNDLNESSSVIALAINGGKKSKVVINWALETLIPQQALGRASIKLLNIFPEIKFAPNPMGSGSVSIKQVNKDVAMSIRKGVESKAYEKLLPYMKLCLRKKVQVEIVLIESDDIINAIAEEIKKCNIMNLVIGASSTGGMFSRGKKLSTRICEACPSSCTVYAVSNERSVLVRQPDPDAIASANVDPVRFSDASNSPNHPMKPKRTMPSPTAPFSPPPNKFYQPSSPLNYSFEREVNFARDFNSSDIDDGVSSSSGSDINERSTASSFSVHGSMDFSSGSQSSRFQEQLRREFRQAHGMYENSNIDAEYTPYIRQNWDAKETANGLILRMYMPGLDKEDVKVSVENNTLIVKGEAQKEFEDEESGRRYINKIDLLGNHYKMNEIKAEMKNGVLRMLLPKIKEEERLGVFHVKVA